MCLSRGVIGTRTGLWDRLHRNDANATFDSTSRIRSLALFHYEWAAR